MCHNNVKNDFVQMFCAPLSENNNGLFELLNSTGDDDDDSESQRVNSRTFTTASISSAAPGRSVVNTLFAPSTNRLAKDRMRALYSWAGVKDERWESNGRECMNLVIGKLLNLDRTTLEVVGHSTDPSMQSVVEKKNCAYRDLMVWTTVTTQVGSFPFFFLIFFFVLFLVVISSSKHRNSALASDTQRFIGEQCDGCTVGKGRGRRGARPTCTLFHSLTRHRFLLAFDHTLSIVVRPGSPSSSGRRAGTRFRRRSSPHYSSSG